MIQEKDVEFVFVTDVSNLTERKDLINVGVRIFDKLYMLQSGKTVDATVGHLVWTTFRDGDSLVPYKFNPDVHHEWRTTTSLEEYTPVLSFDLPADDIAALVNMPSSATYLPLEGLKEVKIQSLSNWTSDEEGIVYDTASNEVQVLAMISGDLAPQFGAWFNATVETLQGKNLVTTGQYWKLTKHGEAFYDNFKKRFQGVPYQERVVTWFEYTFGPAFSDIMERLYRYGEESIELLQAGGVTEDDVIELVRYVYGRPIGEIKQEIGGVITTLMIYCHVMGINFDDAAETELDNIYGRIDRIRYKQQTKPHASPLPGGQEKKELK